MSVTARRAVVTGANRGLGLAVSSGLAQQGLSVVLTGRDAMAVRQAALGLERRGLAVDARALDVSDAASRGAFVEWATRELPGIDVLVNNAGVALDGFDAEIARATLEANFFGTMRLTDALVPLLSEGANVVMVSSGMGELSCVSLALRRRLEDPGLTREELTTIARSFIDAVGSKAVRELGFPENAYRVSKLALNAYARILARELEERVRVVAVCPGWVRTRMGGSSADRSVAEGADGIIRAALAEPQAPTGVFLRDGRSIAW